MAEHRLGMTIVRNIVLLVLVSVHLSSCMMTPGYQALQDLPYTEDTVAPKVNQYPSPSGLTEVGRQYQVEKELLEQLASLLSQASHLAKNAQNSSDLRSKILFDYDSLLFDIQTMEFGINQYMLTRSRTRRFLPQVEDRVIRGDYLKVRH